MRHAWGVGAPPGCLPPKVSPKLPESEMADHRAARPTAAPVGGEQGRPDHVRTPGALAPDAGGRPVIPAWHVVPWRRPRMPPSRPRYRAPGVAVASPGTARTPRDLHATWGQRPAAGRRALRSGKRRCWCGVPGAGGPCGAGSPRGPQVAEAEKTPGGERVVSARPSCKAQGGPLNAMACGF